LQFKTISGSTLSQASALAKDGTANDSLIIEASNGTLQIDDIRFIVEEFKLEPADIEGEDDSLDTDTEEFEAGPFWVDLPLSEDTLSMGDSQIQAGLYEELEFEVENLDLDEDDDGDDQEQRVLADSIRTVFPEWPGEASMVLIGKFTSDDGQTELFKVFADAEIEIEREFATPLEVTEANSQKVLSVQFSPSEWFKKSDGTVIDLSAYDWDENQQLLEFEAEFEKGVKDIEMDDESDDIDNDDD
jgi:hypothetical protein